jgi:hypothetical protein
VQGSWRITSALTIAGALLAGCGGASGDATCAMPDQVAGLRLNEVQVLGSHNSYRRRMYPPLFAFVQGLADSLPDELDPAALDYEHVPLTEQLDGYGVRALELDLYNDQAGGRYYERRALALVNEPTASNLPELRQPGIKVLHSPDFDYETHHLTFRSALATIKAWSDAHPDHLPLFIQLETKEATVADALPPTQIELTTAVPWDAAGAAAIDAEIREVFTEPARLVTPDDVRGTHATLEEAVLAKEWPLLGAARGRVVFFMEGPAIDDYLAGAPGLQGRVVFPLASPGQPHAAFVLRNDPRASEADIADLVRRGYIVRTMADSSTVEARSGDTARAQKAWRSGAQVVSTDYYRPDPRGKQPGSGWTSYEAALPGGGPARSNPVNGGAARRLCQ